MCGIIGFYSKTSISFNKSIEKMKLAISHRGPDSNGTWIDKNSGIALGHQRLSIVDLSQAGHQPMKSNSERYVLIYNGEIYNHLEIRKQIESLKSNTIWKGHSDTETFLEAIELWGIEEALKKIEGMFAFALWDQKLRKLSLARDRIGEKPLYYGFQGNGHNKTFLFGSELKGLKIHPEFNFHINRDAVALQMRLSYIPTPFTIYKDIFKLKPGHYLELNEKDFIYNRLPVSRPYWSLTSAIVYGINNNLEEDENEIKEELESRMKKTIKKRMISEVPLGAFLSGGLDSSSIVALMQSQSNDPIKTFTVGFNESDFNEAVHAKKIAEHLGTDHTEIYISSKEAMDVIPKLSKIYDEPFSDVSQIPTILVSQLAKNNVKVALSGDAGDELFCGYNRHIFSKKFSQIIQPMPLFIRKFLSSSIYSISIERWNKIIKFTPNMNKFRNFGNNIHKFAGILEAKNVEELYIMLCSQWRNPTDIVINSEEPNNLLSNLKDELIGLNFQEEMMALDQITYLPDDILVKVDRAAMASSLETRIPFLDHKIIEYVWRIPHSMKFRNGQGKWILRQILKKYIPSDLIKTQKQGFGVPLDSWLRGPLKDWSESLLNKKKIDNEGFFNSKIIRKKWSDFLSGKRNFHNELWSVLMFQTWLDENN